LSDGAGAGNGDDERPTGPARQASGSAPADPALVDAGGPAAEKSPPGPVGGAPEQHLSEDHPTLPPAPARPEAGLRWAEVGPSPTPGPGPNRPQRNSPPTLPLRGQTSSTAGPSTRPGATSRPQVRARYPARPAGTPSAGRAAPRSPLADAGTGPVPPTRAQEVSGRGAAGDVRPTASVTAPERPSRRGRAIFWLLVIVVVIAACASAAIVLASREATGHRHLPRVSQGEALFEQLLATSSTAQQLTATAVARSCQEPAPGAPARVALLSDLSRAIGLRQSVLHLLDVDRQQLLPIPDGAQLVSDLNAATVAEMTVEQDDQGWLQDLQATGCYSAPTNDVHYRAAYLGSVTAAGADRRLAHAWAVVEPAVGSRS
jgi:hypothetical protein